MSNNVTADKIQVNIGDIIWTSEGEKVTVDANGLAISEDGDTYQIEDCLANRDHTGSSVKCVYHICKDTIRPYPACLCQICDDGQDINALNTLNELNKFQKTNANNIRPLSEIVKVCDIECLAENVGISHEHLLQLINCKPNPTSDVLSKLSKNLKSDMVLASDGTVWVYVNS